MPEEPIYALPYESETSGAPGHSLRPPGPILAEAVATELQRIDSAHAVLDGDFSALESVVGDRARTIATIDSGLGTNTTEFTSIPQTFRDLMIIWYGGSDGTGEIDSLALRFNGDGGNNYISTQNRNTAASAFSSESGTFSVMRAGYVGTDNGGGVVHIPNYSSTIRLKFAHGTTISRGDSGGANMFCAQGGGRWNSSAAISAVRIWPSGQLWSITPHITLLGIM